MPSGSIRYSANLPSGASLFDSYDGRGRNCSDYGEKIAMISGAETVVAGECGRGYFGHFLKILNPPGRRASKWRAGARGRAAI